MGAYLIRRLLLVIPTLWAIITINFFIVQIAPGGPVDQAIAAIEFGNAGVLPGAGGEGVRASHAQTGVGNISDSNYRGGRGLDPEVIAKIQPLKHIISLIIRVLHVAVIFHLTTGNTFAVAQKIQ